MVIYGLYGSRNMKGREGNTDDRKRQEQHKTPNTNLTKHEQNKTQASV